MRLKLQMLVAGLVTLAIPLAGWHSIRQLDDSLEETRLREQHLRVVNMRAALAENETLQSQLMRRTSPARVGDLFASTARYPVLVDGYDDDWWELKAPAVRFENTTPGVSKASASLRVRGTVDNRTLHLFVQVADTTVLFHKPPDQVVDYAEGEQPDPFERLSNGDALEVFVQTPNGNATHALFRVVAPGPLVARVASASQRRRLGATVGAWRGHWNATANGMQLEMTIPLPPDGSRLGLAYVDIDKRGEARHRWVGSMSPARMALLHRGDSKLLLEPRVFRASSLARDALLPWVTPTTRARLFDAEGRLVADVNALYEKDETQIAFDPAKSSLWDALVYRFVSTMLADRDDVFTKKPLFKRTDALHLPESVLVNDSPLKDTRRYLTDEADLVLGSITTLSNSDPAKPSTIGYLLFESNDARASSYAGSRLAQLLSMLTLVSLLVGGMLLLFATVLSFRVRRLSKRAAAAVSRDGRVSAFTPTTAKDEIGELSRTLAALLGRTAHYTHYLEALSSRLSHELRTPLSVVKTSLENIDADKLDADTQKLLDRAGGGADQLGHIIRALVESTRLEQTVQRAQKVHIPLDTFLRGAKSRYQQVHAGVVFNTEFSGPATLYGSPELLQQALDKLVDNAVSFTTDGVVTLGLSSYQRQDTAGVRFSVSNAGHVASGTQAANVFDPMFSSRDRDDGNLHLGLGLYIVRMVAEAHNGRATFSVANGEVTVGMEFPINEDGS